MWQGQLLMAAKSAQYGSNVKNEAEKEKKKNNPLILQSKRRAKPFQKQKPVTNQDTIQKERTDRCSKSSENIFINMGRK